jgi:hypothetical protein
VIHNSDSGTLYKGYGEEAFQSEGFQSRELPRNIKESLLEWRWMGRRLKYLS